MKNSFKIPKWRQEDTLGVILMSIFIAFFYYLSSRQEEGISIKLKECSFYTIITPIRMPDSHKMYFYYIYNNKRYESSGSVGAEDLGFFYTKNSALRGRYWLQVYCKDFKVDRVH